MSEEQKLMWLAEAYTLYKNGFGKSAWLSLFEYELAKDECDSQTR